MQPNSDFDPKTATKKLMREARSGALATLMAGSGDPYCSLVNVATAVDGTPLLLISRLAVHTKNVLADPRASLMLDERKEGDPLQGARVMLMGTVARTESPDARRRYLAYQPEAEMFAGFADFAFYELKLKGAHLVAGFGRIVDLTPADLLTDVGDAKAMLDASFRHRAHECRPCRNVPAVRDEAARRDRRRVALRRLRS
jgi:putative heme iron utilization protein